MKRFILLLLIGFLGAKVSQAQQNLAQNGDLEILNPPPYTYNGSFLHLVSAEGWGVCKHQTHPLRPNTNTPNLVTANQMQGGLSTFGNYSGYIEQEMNLYNDGWLGLEENAAISFNGAGAGTYDFSIQVAGSHGQGDVAAGLEIVLIEDCGGPEIPVLTHTVGVNSGWTQLAASVNLTAAQAASFNTILIRMDYNYVELYDRALYFDEVTISKCGPDGDFEIPTSACVSEPIELDVSAISYDQGSLQILIEQTAPNSLVGLYSYTGPEPATSIDINDPANYGPQGVLQPIGNSPSPYTFECPNNCAYYNVKVRYEICGDLKPWKQKTLHVTCCELDCDHVQASYLYYYGIIGCQVSFFDNSTTDPGDPIISWAWDFGDGSGGSGQNVSHAYAPGATYTACLTVTTASGCEKTTCRTVTCSGGGGGEGKGGGQFSDNFSIFPNPTNQQATLRYRVEERASLQLFNLTGQVIKSYTLAPERRELRLDLSNLPSSIYFAKVVSNGKVLYQEKLFVQ